LQFIGVKENLVNLFLSLKIGVVVCLILGWVVLEVNDSLEVVEELFIKTPKGILLA
jgi:hypothetical protein